MGACAPCAGSRVVTTGPQGSPRTHRWAWRQEGSLSDAAPSGAQARSREGELWRRRVTAPHKWAGACESKHRSGLNEAWQTEPQTRGCRLQGTSYGLLKFWLHICTESTNSSRLPRAQSLQSPLLLMKQGLSQHLCLGRRRPHPP